MRITRHLATAVTALACLSAGLVAAPPEASAATTIRGCAAQGVNPSMATISNYLDAAATRYDLPPQLLKVIAYQESAGEGRGWRQFDTNGRTIYNPEDGKDVGGVGIMQLTGQTARDSGDLCRLFVDTAYNIDRGARVLSQKMAKASEGMPAKADRALIENWYLAARYYNGGGAAANSYAIRAVTNLRKPPSPIARYTVPIAVTGPRQVWSKYAEPVRIRATASGSWTFYSSKLNKAVVARGKGAVHAWKTGPYVIRNAAGFCVDLPGFGKGTRGGVVQQHSPCDRTSRDNQRFWFTYQRTYQGAKGTYKVYEIKNVKDGLCLDVPNFGDNDAGTEVSEFTCGGPADNQSWYRVPRPAGGAWLVNLKSKLCLDAAGAGATQVQDARLTLYHCSEAQDHRWSLVR